VNVLLNRLAALGEAWDRAAATTRRAPRNVGTALANRPSRRAGIVVALVVLVLYLIAIGDIAFSISGRWSSAPFLQTAPGNVLATRAPYLFEPVLALHLTGHVAVFLSPINLLLGAIVAALAGANLATARYVTRHAPCRRGYGRLLGALPAFLLGFACCTPTLLLALGTSTSAAVLPVVLPLRPIFYPLTLALLLTALVWGTRGMAVTSSPPPAVSPRPARKA
jgi:hypothetical protein